MTIFYKDLFNGSGNFDGRTPDVGDQYHVFGGPDSQLDSVLLSGDGRVPEYNSFDLGGPVYSGFTRSSGDQLLTVDFEAIHDDTFVDFRVNLVDTDSSTTLVATELLAQGPGWILYTTVSLADTTIVYSNGVDVSASITGSPQVLTVEITGTGVVWKIDGVEVDNSGGAIPDIHPNAVGWQNCLIGTDPTPPVAFYIDSMEYDASAPATNEMHGSWDSWTLEGAGGGQMHGAWHAGPFVARGGAQMHGSWDSWRLTARGGAVMHGRYGGWRLFGFGHETQPMGMHGSWGLGPLNARGGAQMHGVYGSWRLAASASIANRGIMHGFYGGWTISGSWHQTIIGRAHLKLRGAVTLSARGGGQMHGTFPMPILRASSSLTNLGRMHGIFPPPFLTAHASFYNRGIMHGIFPMPYMTPLGRMHGVFPMPTLRAFASSHDVVVYEAYSATLLQQRQEGDAEVAVTHLTNYPFERIVRFQGHYYGVGPDGLFLLEGDTFDGDPIVGFVQTHETDHGSDTFKRYPMLYLYGRVGADFDVTLITTELENDTYQYRVLSKPGATAHRVPLGRGIKAHYAAYALSNVAGEDFSIESLVPEIETLKRSV